MARIQAVYTTDGRFRGLQFYCPGCKESHTVSTRWCPPGKEAVTINRHTALWVFNGDFVKPTLSPSVLVRTGHYADGNTKSCWCRYKESRPEEPDSALLNCTHCHSFVWDGKIQFLNDCSHVLKGQTVDLPEIEP